MGGGDVLLCSVPAPGRGDKKAAGDSDRLESCRGEFETKAPSNRAA